MQPLPLPLSSGSIHDGHLCAGRTAAHGASMLRQASRNTGILRRPVGLADLFVFTLQVKNKSHKVGFLRVKAASKKARSHLHDSGIPEKQRVYIKIFFSAQRRSFLEWQWRGPS